LLVVSRACHDCFTIVSAFYGFEIYVLDIQLFNYYLTEEIRKVWITQLNIKLSDSYKPVLK